MGQLRELVESHVEMHAAWNTWSLLQGRRLRVSPSSKSHMHMVHAVVSVSERATVRKLSMMLLGTVLSREREREEGERVRGVR
jgi:hypothetical protein